MIEKIEQASKRIEPYIKHVGLYYSHNFTEMFNAEMYMKLENLQRTGSFKLRGALNAILTNQEKCKNGIVTASAGNHAQGVAFSCRALSLNATIVMPIHTPLVKINNTKKYGANVVLHGSTFDDSNAHAEMLAKQEGLYYVHPFNDEDVIAGQGTIAKEILAELPDADNIIVPIGGGGLISGVLSYIKESGSKAKVIGVQSESVSGMATSMRNRKLTRVSGASFVAEGISVKSVGDKTFDICSKYLDEIVTVSDNDIAAAVLTLLEVSKLVVEGAGATPLAAIMSRKVDYRNKKNVMLISGGNIDINMITRIISKGLSSSGRFLEVAIILRDAPGSLATVTKFLADNGANILNIRHDRYGAGLPIGFSRVNLELETKSNEHIEQIVISLNKAGYDVSVC